MVVRTWVEEGKNLAGNFFDLVGKCVPRCGARGKIFSRDLARDLLAGELPSVYWTSSFCYDGLIRCR